MYRHWFLGELLLLCPTPIITMILIPLSVATNPTGVLLLYCPTSLDRAGFPLLTKNAAISSCTIIVWGQLILVAQVESPEYGLRPGRLRSNFKFRCRRWRYKLQGTQPFKDGESRVKSFWEYFDANTLLPPILLRYSRTLSILMPTLLLYHTVVL